MESVHIPPQEQARGGSTIAVYLSLFLVVLAFFILLVTISSVEQVKSNAVMDSLTSTFASVMPPSTDLTPFAAKEGDVIAGQVFQEEVTGFFCDAASGCESRGRTARTAYAGADPRRLAVPRRRGADP